MSRKTITFIAAILASAVIAFGEYLGIDLGIEKGQIIIVLVSALGFIFGIQKLDKYRNHDRLKADLKWSDSEFIVGVLGMLFPFINHFTGLNVSVETVAPIIVAIIGIIVGYKRVRLS